MKKELKQLGKEWESFKLFREARWEANKETEEYKEAQKNVEDVFESQKGRDYVFSMFGCIDMEMDFMWFNLAIKRRSRAQNANIPSETFEGMLEWINMGCPK
jgi:hypothetical protein